MDKNSIQLISSINFWKGKINISSIKGGITNKNFLVVDRSKKYFVRIGDDIPEHLVLDQMKYRQARQLLKLVFVLNYYLTRNQFKFLTMLKVKLLSLKILKKI